MLIYKQKKNQKAKANRLLISITFVGSAGPIRFVVSEDELVGAVIDRALKSYAREGRLPALGSNLDNFMLYCPISGTEAMSPWEAIGSAGVRNFMLCKKPQSIERDESPRKASWRWKSWFNKSLNLKISTH